MKKSAIAFLLILVFGFLSAVGCRSLMQTLYPKRYAEIVEKYSEAYGVDANLIYAVMHTESSFHNDAKSEVGASGLMQIMPETLEWLNMRMGTSIRHEALQDPDTAIRCGTFLLDILLDEFGNTDTAIAAYHAGRGCVNEWLANPDYSADGNSLQNIPYRDTAHYVRKVSRTVQIYKNLYKTENEMQ